MKSSSPGVCGSATCVLGLTALYVLFLYQTERTLTFVEEDQQVFRYHGLLFQQSTSRKNNNTTESKIALPTALKDERFLLFSGDLASQGQGNIVSGLLAAHLLGLEFHRIVCVLPDYSSFLEVFEAIDTAAVNKCRLLFNNLPPQQRDNSIHIVNYSFAPNECELKELLLNSKKQVLYFSGNTYPRWPSVPDRFFMSLYQATPVLINALPYIANRNPPSTVVHLRSPDTNAETNRLGLDDASLIALGELLPKGKDTYLVTNQVSFYQRFVDCCQWSHPLWNGVKHSALHITWDSLNVTQNDVPAVSQNVQMWADWYTILNAKAVYHTHSDFSISALHWMNNKNAHSIMGLNVTTGILETRLDSWVTDVATVCLSKRTKDATDDSKLRLCEKKNTFDHFQSSQSRRFADHERRHKHKADHKSIGRHRHEREFLFPLLDRAPTNNRFLLYNGDLSGQGAGNIVSGLLAAHLFGQEFNRTVCIVNFDSFLEVFDTIGEQAKATCPLALAHRPPPSSVNTIVLINYMGPVPNECELKSRLNGSESILYLNGNTYPRWPVIPDRFFFQHYQANNYLLSALPFNPNHPPSTVVHLRVPDDVYDIRKGLDEASLNALGEALPKGKDTMLVTNRVALFQQFNDCCGWSHPPWNNVKHSGNSLDWGSREGSRDSGKVVLSQNVQLWADWYTLLVAPTVYHTHSDFSVSAIHWMNKKNNTFSIVGVGKGGTLETTSESWLVDGETIPLSQRTLEADGTAKLRKCD